VKHSESLTVLQGRTVSVLILALREELPFVPRVLTPAGTQELEITEFENS
jgi:hypothetical protein